MKKSINRRDFLHQCGRCALLCAGMDAFLWMTSPFRAKARSLQKGLFHRKLSLYFTPLAGNGDGDERKMKFEFLIPVRQIPPWFLA